MFEVTYNVFSGQMCYWLAESAGYNPGNSSAPDRIWVYTNRLGTLGSDNS